MKCELIGLLAICGRALAPVVHRPQATAAGLDWLFAAAIGVGGSVLGGLTGGWFALHAGNAQWQRDREASRTDHSHQAALAIAGDIASLQGAVETWSARHEDVNALVAAFNAFSLSAAVQSIGLIDDELRRRISYHTLLARELSASAGVHGAVPSQSALAGTVQTLAETVRRHTEAVLEAIDAHVNGQPLPPYQPPPVDTTASC
jgi:hypothetical protein